MTLLMTDTLPIVFVVDDDPSIRRALERLVRSAGLRTETFTSAREFLDSRPSRTDAPSCLVLDINLPGLSGLDLQDELSRANVRLPIVFITGHGDIPMSVRAMKAGAVDFLPKPFDDADLLRAIENAHDRDAAERQRRAESGSIGEKLARLTPREREVFEQVVQGKLNKQVASALGVAEKTVKVHRARVMEKMEARSLADLVRMAERREADR